MKVGNALRGRCMARPRAGLRVYAQFGHAAKRGGPLRTHADQTYRHPEDAKRAARATFQKMLEFRMKNDKPLPEEARKLEANFEKESADMDADTKKKKVKWLEAHGIKLSDKEIGDMSLPENDEEPPPRMP